MAESKEMLVPDVYDHIIGHLCDENEARITLLRYGLVSKEWAHLARAHAWSELCLGFDVHDFTPWYSRLAKVFALFQEHPRYYNLVDCIKLSFSGLALAKGAKPEERAKTVEAWVPRLGQAYGLVARCPNLRSLALYGGLYSYEVSPFAPQLFLYGLRRCAGELSALTKLAFHFERTSQSLRQAMYAFLDVHKDQLRMVEILPAMKHEIEWEGGLGQLSMLAGLRMTKPLMPIDMGVHTPLASLRALFIEGETLSVDALFTGWLPMLPGLAELRVDIPLSSKLLDAPLVAADLPCLVDLRLRFLGSAQYLPKLDREPSDVWQVNYVQPSVDMEPIFQAIMACFKSVPARILWINLHDVHVAHRCLKALAILLLTEPTAYLNCAELNFLVQAHACNSKTFCYIDQLLASTLEDLDALYYDLVLPGLHELRDIFAMVYTVPSDD